MVKQNNHLGDIAENSGYGIGAVSSLTGISPDTLRVWEKRYAIVQPKRTPSGNRVYSQEDLNHLLIIKRLLDAGASGYLTRDCDSEELIQAIRVVAGGQRYIGSEAAKQLEIDPDKADPAAC